MGEEHYFQPLTRWDKITVYIYRTGIFLSAVIISAASYILFDSLRHHTVLIGPKINIFIILLYVSAGMGVFSIHLYVRKIKKALIKLYIIALACLIVLFLIGRGDISDGIINTPYSLLLLLPLSCCLGFITAKEAFCFKLTEGYILALVMPLCIFLLATGGLSLNGASYMLILISLLLAGFTVRKISMPVHYDIGDKSAYN